MQPDFSNINAHYRAEQAARQAAYTELCRHLEHAPDAQLLSDHTAVLLFALDSDQRPDAVRMLKGQLYSRSSRDTGRVDSWLADCTARLQEDKEGFLAHAQEEYLRAGLAAEEQQRQARSQKHKPRLLPASAFAPEVAEYLVEPYLPRGMVSILGGVSGAGKTSLALDVCAKLSRGVTPSVIAPRCQLPPEGAFHAKDNFPAPPEASLLREVAASETSRRKESRQPQTIFYLTAENDPNKVLRPRAEAMGADLDRLYFQAGASYHMADEELYALCRAHRPALLVFDPIQSYLGPGIQMNRAEQVRPLLDGLGALARELNMAVLLISHMSKPGPGVSSALDRLLGSSDFRNAARSILIVGRDPEHPDTRVVAHAKNSLGLPGDSQRYHIQDNGTVAYDGPCDLSADRIIQDAGGTASHTRPAATLNAAVEALDKQLSFVGWVEYAEVERLCAKHGFSERTMRRARIALGLKTATIGVTKDRKSIWYRSELTEADVIADYTNQHEQLVLS